jgi:large subunit ribosomal protein L15
VSLQTSIALLNSPQVLKRLGQDEFGRQPFTHPALDGLPSLTQDAIDGVLSTSRLGPLAERYGLDKVTRWKPRLVRLLHSNDPRPIH